MHSSLPVVRLDIRSCVRVRVSLQVHFLAGMAAITAVLLAFLRKGDRVLAQNVLYGTTRSLCLASVPRHLHLVTYPLLVGGTYTFMAHELPKMGIEVSFFDATQYSSSWDTLVTPTTKVSRYITGTFLNTTTSAVAANATANTLELVYTEGLTNPLLQVADHEAVVSFARKHKLV
jgi:cystathionine beta-lyase/cystathionine gamma-synthase